VIPLEVFYFKCFIIFAVTEDYFLIGKRKFFSLQKKNIDVQIIKSKTIVNRCRYVVNSEFLSK